MVLLGGSGRGAGPGGPLRAFQVVATPCTARNLCSAFGSSAECRAPTGSSLDVGLGPPN